MDKLKLLPGVEINSGDTIVKCEGCGLAGRPKDLKNNVTSIKHKHHSAHKAQKYFAVKIKFHHIDEEGNLVSNLASLCSSCLKQVINGAAFGGMYK